MDPLVSAGWLADRLDSVRVVSASKHLDGEGRDPAAEFAAARIPGAVRLDLDAFGGGTRALPGRDGMAGMFAAAGIGDDRPIVVYDDTPLHSAARAWWLLRQAGRRDVALLDGGLARWRAEGRPVEAGAPHVRAAGFAAGAGAGSLRLKEDVAAALASGAAQVVDARSAARFAGAAAEPRAGVEAGHMPGALNLPLGDLFRPDGTWKRDAALRAAFEDAGVDPDRPVIATCGSGVTAAAIAFALHLLGRPDAGLYNGSWAEWGSDPATAKARGA